MRFTQAVPIEERFWPRVSKNPNGCWIWIGPRHRQGYGRVGFKGDRGAYAHRVAWEITYGTVPDGLHVLHRCDNPPCVRPDHLFLGTHHDNMIDMGRKRRRKRFWSKLSLEQARRAKYGDESLMRLAEEFNVKYQTLWYIRKGVTWRTL